MVDPIDYSAFYERIATALETVATNSTAIKNSLDAISTQTTAIKNGLETMATQTTTIATQQKSISATSERVASSVEYFKNYGLVSRSLMDELNSYMMSKTILDGGVALKDAVKSGRDLQKAVMDAVKPLNLNPSSNNSDIMPLSIEPMVFAAISDTMIEPMAFDVNSDITIPDPIRTLSISGVWNSSQRYLKDQMVSYKNEIWVCVRDSSNVVPSDDPSYWMQVSSDDIANIRAAPILTKIADDIYSITPAPGEIVYDPISKEKLIGKVGGGTMPFTNDTINQTAGPPRATYMGLWSGKKAYKKGDVVTDKTGKHWVSNIKKDPSLPFGTITKAPVGVTPSENTDWYETKKIDEILKGNPELVSDSDIPKFKGPWSDVAKYAKNNVVSNNDKYWLAKKNSPGPIPPLSNDWWETKDIDAFPVQINPPPIFVVTPSALIVDEGSTVTFTVTGINIEDGTYYWSTESIGISLDLNSNSELPITLRNGTATNLDITDNSLAIALRNSTIDNLSIDNNLLSIVVRGANDSFSIILRNGLSVKVDVINDNLGITLRNDDNLNARIINGKLPVTLHNSGTSIPVRLIDGSSITKVNIRELSESVGTSLSITLRDSSIVNLNINNNLLPVRLFDNSIINLSITNNLLPVVLNGNSIAYVNIGTANVTLGSGLPINLRNGSTISLTINNNLLSVILRNGIIVDLTISNNLLPVTLLDGNITNISIGTANVTPGSGLPINLRNGSTISLTINNNLLPITLHNGTTVNITISNNLLPVTLLDGNITNISIGTANVTLGPGIPVTLRNGINIKVGITNNRLSITLRNGNIIDIIIDDSNSIVNVDITNGGNFGNSFGAFNIIDNLGSFTIMPTADLTTEGNEKFIVSIRSSSTSGALLAISEPVTINDTSLTPVPPHTTWNASIYYLKEEIVEFCGLFYKAKVNTFRTIPSRSPNDWERRYY